MVITALIRSAFVLVLAGVCPGKSYAQEAILIDDATVVAAKPTSVALSTSLKVVGPLNSHAEQDSFLKFDLSTLPAGTAGSNILNATLVLYVDSLTGTGSFNVASVEGVWDERTVTWATAPAIITVEAAGVVKELNQFVTVDLTELVKDWVNGVVTNGGIALVPNSSSVVVGFDSKENKVTSHPARLLIATSSGSADLQGPSGPQGPKGDTGPQGPPGSNTNQNVSSFIDDSGYVTATVTNGLATTNQNVSVFTNDANYVTEAVTNGLADLNALLGKASTNIFSGSNTGLVANAGVPDTSKFLRQDGTWIAPSGATNGFVSLNDLNATNDALRIGSQAVTNGLPDANALAGKAATNQNISLFPDDAGYVTMAVTNGLPDSNALAGKAAINQNVSLFPNDAGYATADVTNGLETISAASALTNNFVSASVTNGLATTNQNVSVFTNDANYVTEAVTNGLADLNALLGKASTNIFSGSNTGLVANAGVPNTSKFLRQDGTWIAPSGATNGFASLSDLNATNNALRVGPQAVTNGLETITAAGALASTNLLISTSNKLAAATLAITNGLETISAAGALTNGFVKASVTNGLPTTTITNGLETITAAGALASINLLTSSSNTLAAATLAITNGLETISAASVLTNGLVTTNAALNALRVNNAMNLTNFPAAVPTNGNSTAMTMNGAWTFNQPISASTNTAASTRANAAVAFGMSFTNGNFRSFYAASVSMVSTTVVDFINVTDATTNTTSVAATGGLVLTNSVFLFAGPNEVLMISTNRSKAGQAPGLIRVTGKIL